MSAGLPDMQPDVDEVLQTESYVPQPVEVTVCTPVRMQSLPRKAGATRQRTVGLVPIQLVGADHRRASITLVSVGQNMLVALSAASAQDPSLMALWPANVPLVVNATVPVFVASASATTVVSYVTEDWATGEGAE